MIKIVTAKCHLRAVTSRWQESGKIFFLLLLPNNISSVNNTYYVGPKDAIYI